MFFLPAIVSLPIVEVLNFGSIDSPSLGTYLAAFLLAALVGSALGILRLSGHQAPPEASNRRARFRPVGRLLDMAHKATA